MTNEEWLQLNYAEIFRKRIKRLEYIRDNPDSVKSILEYYKHNPVDYINDWCVTVDPRNVGTNRPTKMPFILFPKQVEFIEWLYSLAIERHQNGLVEKCRDYGATWCACAFSQWLWRFHPGSAVGFGSRKEILVDKLGDMSSIFQKIRAINENMPAFLMPKGFQPKKHSTFMKLINPENGSTITGESGDNIGRGGRTTIYFKDESAHYERPEKIEAALGENTNVQIDISSVNGHNIFYYTRQNLPEDRVFIMDWRDHPAKDDEWYRQKKEEYNAKGIPHLFAQEVDRDYAGAVKGVLIPARWVRAAIDAHIKLNIKVAGERRGALDVADEGGDLNALADRHGILLKSVETWPEGSTTETANYAFRMCSLYGITRLAYDSIGVGAGVKGEAKRQSELQKESKKKGKNIEVIGWNAGGKVVNGSYEYAEGKKNKDMFINAKAQAGWLLRERFRKTYEVVEQCKNHDHDELISINSQMDGLQFLCAELSQPTWTTNDAGKIKINKKPEGTKSPNRYDAVAMAFAPIQHDKASTPSIVGLYY